jgi:hypothetical protein
MDSSVDGHSQAVTAPLRAARILFLANALIWVGLGAAMLARSTAVLGPQVRWVLAAAMLANAAMMGWLGVRIVNGSRRLYVLALCFLAVNILLTVTDQFGLWDGITLVIDAVLVALLLHMRSRFSSGA